MTHPIPARFTTLTLTALGLLTGCASSVIARSDDESAVAEPAETEPADAQPSGAEAQDPHEPGARPSPPGFEPVVAIAAGRDHVCATSMTGRLRCWGGNAFGQLGQGHTETIGASDVPLDHPDVPLAGPALALAAGADHTCALRPRGLRCWGRGDALALGRGSYDPTHIGDDETPASAGDAVVADQDQMRSLALGGAHSCALTESGAARCWGSSELGALGYGYATLATGGELTNGFAWVPLGDGIVELEAGEDHTCAITLNGHVRCWGEAIALGGGGQENIGDDEPACLAPTVSFLEAPAIALAAGSGFTCALDELGLARCWGAGEGGVLGQASTADIPDGNDAPPVSMGAPAVAITAGAHHACVITDTQTVRCWGSGAFGALGYGSTDDVGDDETPATMGNVALPEPALAITAGDGFTCALLESGKVTCWGRGDHGALGQGDTAHIGDDELPVDVAPFGVFDSERGQ